MKKPLLLIVFSVMVSAAIHAADVKYLEMSIPDAKKVAKEYNRPLLVIFHTDWSNKSRKMFSQTLSDKKVADYINANYVALKVDVDDFSGSAYKTQYKITRLPTLMAFDASGKFKGRLEGYSNDKETYLWLSDFVPLKPVAKPAPAAPVRPTPSNLIAKSVDLETVAPRRISTHAFSVQMGAYSSYGNALQQVEKAQSKLGTKVEIFIEMKEGSKSPYKVMSGRFGSRKDAYVYQREVAQKGINGFVAKL